MSTIKELVGTAKTNAITTGLDSLANGNTALSAAIDNSAGLDLFMDLSLSVKYTSSAPAAGVVAADAYLVPSIDGGTTYAEGTAGTPGVIPQGALYVGSFESRNGSTSTFENLVLNGIPIGPYNYKLLLVNKSGKTFTSSGNVLAYATYKFQSV